MGRMYAEGIKEFDISLERQIGIHLQNNHYPPVSPIFVSVAIEAIQKVNDGEGNEIIIMPNNISKTAYQVVEGLHLDTWCYGDEDYDG